MEQITSNISNEFRIGVKQAIQQEQKRIIEIIKKYIKATKHDLKYSCEDKQQELMCLYLLRELDALKYDIEKQQIQEEKK